MCATPDPIPTFAVGDRVRFAEWTELYIRTGMRPVDATVVAIRRKRAADGGQLLDVTIFGRLFRVPASQLYASPREEE